MGTYLVDVSSILSEPGASLEIDDPVPLESLTIGDTIALFDAYPTIRLSISNTGDGLALFGTVEANATLDCSRCLEPFSLMLSGSIEGVATRPDRRESFGEDEEWYPLEDEGSLDLMPAVKAALGVEIPYAPLHDEECQGICSACGCDLNRESCSCPEEPEDRDHPFAALKDLLEPNDDR